MTTSTNTAAISSLSDTKNSTSEINISTEDLDRNNLACAFRLAERFGFHEGICNHFSLRLDGGEERYLINPYGVHWSQMSSEALLLIDGDGNVLAGDGVVEDSARFIHVAAHRANLRHKVVLHTHMPFATTLTMLDGEAGQLPMTHQTAVRFHGRVAYESRVGGLAQSPDEGNRLARESTTSAEIDVLFLANHGVVVNGESVAQAFDDLYYLERACRQHVLALQTGAPLKLIPEDVVTLTARQFQRDMPEFADQHFAALKHVLTTHPEHTFTF